MNSERSPRRRSAGERGDWLGQTVPTFAAASSSVSLAVVACSARSFSYARASRRAGFSENVRLSVRGLHVRGAATGPLTSVPLSLSSSADCACSILPTRTMSCLTFLRATCAQHSSRESPQHCWRRHRGNACSWPSSKPLLGSLHRRDRPPSRCPFPPRHSTAPPQPPPQPPPPPRARWWSAIAGLQ